MPGIEAEIGTKREGVLERRGRR